jgi:ketosteroid isomerase-like protein
MDRLGRALMKIITAAAACAALMTALPAMAQGYTPEQIIQRHMQFGAANDAKAMAGDYADDGVILSPGRAVRGKAAILASFIQMLGPEPSSPAKLDIHALKITSDGDVGIVFWEVPNGPHGEDTFLVRDGKILVQAVFIGATPGAPAR